ncbi:uncharacterized protein PG986_014004 [Apiospora aurea]|uniref:Uncharacterized protein n=1 Tax=Apiospora aurea TaxID=335848 RepID=A0ABR1PX87_9PEZI
MTQGLFAATAEHYVSSYHGSGVTILLVIFNAAANANVGLNADLNLRDTLKDVRAQGHASELQSPTARDVLSTNNESKIEPEINGKQLGEYALSNGSGRHGMLNDNDFYDRMKFLFFSVDFGTSSVCQVDPAPVAEAPATGISQLIKAHLPSGTFDFKTQDGMCQYKSDGKGNAGALWCGDKAYSCKEHADFRKEREGDVYCRNLSTRITGFVEQRPVVACEW